MVTGLAGVPLSEGVQPVSPLLPLICPSSTGAVNHMTGSRGMTAHQCKHSSKFKSSSFKFPGPGLNRAALRLRSQPLKVARVHDHALVFLTSSCSGTKGKKQARSWHGVHPGSSPVSLKLVAQAVLR